MELKSEKNYKQYLFIIPLVLFFIIMALVVTDAVKPVDYFVYHLMQDLISRDFLDIVIAITELGSLIGIVAMIIVFLVYNYRLGGWLIVISLFGQGINRIIKAIVQRPRPSFEHLVHETNYSFPSGHSMAVTCLYGLLIAYMYNSDNKYKKPIMIIYGLIILLVCLSRVYLGVHYFSDVLAGFLLSLSMVMVLARSEKFNSCKK